MMEEGYLETSNGEELPVKNEPEKPRSNYVVLDLPIYDSLKKRIRDLGEKNQALESKLQDMKDYFQALKLPPLEDIYLETVKFEVGEDLFSEKNRGILFFDFKR